MQFLVKTAVIANWRGPTRFVFVHRMPMFIVLLASQLGLATILSAQEASQTSEGTERLNILMIAVDDLRPELNSYGHSYMVTPNLDRLGAEGVRFDQAFCNIAVCGASRASLLKGLRPNPSRFTSYLTRGDEDARDVPSLPMVFKQNGYRTASNGKVYHHVSDDVDAWTQPAWRQKRSSSWWALAENQPDKNSNSARGPAYEAADLPDSEYPDHQVCDKTIADLQAMAKSQKPFFIACGFYRPHLPFNVPQKYWDLYPLDSIQLPDNMSFPKDLSQAFDYKWGELRSYRGIPSEGPVDDKTARNLIRGYRASVSFMDAQVGRLLDELESLNLRDKTIVILWGDHGWQLGEHGFWCKHTNFEVASRTPLIISAPGFGRGENCERLVEFVDIYPTLCDLAGLAKPGHLQGESFVNLMRDTTSGFKKDVITRFGGGDAIRTEDFRYMEMRGKGGNGELRGIGMFDLRNDPGENQDVSQLPEYQEQLERLKARLEMARAASKN